MGSGRGEEEGGEKEREEELRPVWKINIFK